MPWWQFALLGVLGGVLVEVLEIFRWTAVWQEARRTRGGPLKRILPKWRSYVDLPAHAFMLPARAALGAAASTLFGTTGQVTGAYGAVAFGCAAPLLLAQLGLFPQIAKAVGDVRAAAKPEAALTPVAKPTIAPSQESPASPVEGR
jgi:hypothetical protein